MSDQGLSILEGIHERLAERAAKDAAELATKRLQLAGELPRPTVDVMAHALGWPNLYAIENSKRLRRPKWREPYRNHFCCAGDNPAWLEAQVAGLATVQGPQKPSTFSTWTVTDLGIAVLRLRLRAEIEVRRGQ